MTAASLAALAPAADLILFFVVGLVIGRVTRHEPDSPWSEPDDGNSGAVLTDPEWRKRTLRIDRREDSDGCANDCYGR